MSSTVIDTFSKDLSSTNSDPDKTSLLDGSENTLIIESQKMDTETQINIPPSIQKHSDDLGPNAKLDGKTSIEDSVVESLNNSKDGFHQDQNSKDVHENSANTSIEGIDPVVENGILEKGPTLRYEYKPGKH